MATITASLERSLQNCSLNQTSNRSRRTGGGGGPSSSSDSPNHHHHHHHHQRHNNDDDDRHPQSLTHSTASSSDDNSTFVDLNSHVSLPYHWEQCLDLKTGEIYYINWSNGMKAKEDPRTKATAKHCYYSEEEEEEEESNGYDSEGSSTETSPCSSTSTRESFRSTKKLVAPGSGGCGSHGLLYNEEEEEEEEEELSSESVLVVAGCRSCFMYYMVPKQEEDCPKCSGHLLHFPAHHKPSS